MGALDSPTYEGQLRGQVNAVFEYVKDKKCLFLTLSEMICRCSGAL